MKNNSSRYSCSILIAFASILSATIGHIIYPIQDEPVSSRWRTLPSSSRSRSQNPSAVSSSKTNLHPNILKVAESSNHFALEVYKLLAQEDATQNIAFCPVSLTTLLSMVYLGATGNTAAEINATLGYFNTGLEEEQLSEAFRMVTETLVSKTNGSTDYRTILRLANSFWLRKIEGRDIETNFKDSVKRYFDASVTEVENFADLETTNAINQWVSNSTDGLIPTIVDRALSSDLRVMLLSVVYFKSQWETRFDIGETLPGRFRLGNVRTRAIWTYVPMMKVQLQARYGRSEALGAEIVELPYKERQTSMLIIVPDLDASLELIESQLNPETILDLISSMKTQTVALTMPRFEISETINLKKTLSRLGMSSLFDPTAAELQGIDGQGDLFVSEVMQKVVVKVNEEGSEAAAVTGTLFTKKRIDKKIVNANRPFMFLIGHVQTGAILFMGRVAKP